MGAAILNFSDVFNKLFSPLGKLAGRAIYSLLLFLNEFTLIIPIPWLWITHISVPRR